MKTLYLLAGCHGAGKTTVAYALLPDLPGCREFVNADEIARGLSPFQPETVSISEPDCQRHYRRNTSCQGGYLATVNSGLSCLSSKQERAAEITEKLAVGLVAAYQAMLAFKAYKNSPVIIVRAGQIVAVPASEMPPAPN